MTLSVYFFILIISGALMFFYILLSDAIDGALDIPFVSPQLVLAFLAIFSASGYLMTQTISAEKASPLAIMVVSTIISAGFTLILHIFIFAKLRAAESSLAFVETDLHGRVAKVITSIPVNGFGEIIIESASGMIAKPAQSYNGEVIDTDTKVVIIEIKQGVAIVSVYEIPIY